MFRVLMVGQFPPPVTGEGVVNDCLFNDLIADNCFRIFRVNSVIVDDVGSVGKFGLIKLFKAILVLIRSIFIIPVVHTVYLVPGQTVFGLCRFLLISIFARILFKRLVVHWHGYGILHLLGKIPLLSRFFLSLSSVNIVLTEDLINKVKHLGVSVERFEVVKNYSNAEFVPRMPNKSARLRVLYLGSLMPEKGIVEFLDVAVRCPDMDFYICGAGVAEFIDKCVLAADKHPNIFYLGLVSGVDKFNILSSSDVFVLQTYYPTEGVPLSLLDAMKAGCAVITTAHNGIPETVCESVVFVRSKSASDLMDALISMDSNRSDLFRFCAMASERSHNFSQEVFLMKMKNILALSNRA